MFRRHREPSAEGVAFRELFDRFNLGDQPEPFGLGRRWLAVRGDRPRLVAENLDAAVAPCRWATGLHLAGDDERLFVTPAVEGWVMVVGVEPSDDNLLRLSTTIAPTFGFDTTGRPGWCSADGPLIERHLCADADEVLAKARELTLDPRTLDALEQAEGPGWLGRLIRLRSVI